MPDKTREGWSGSEAVTWQPRKPGPDPGSGTEMLRDFPRSLQATFYKMLSHLAELARLFNDLNGPKSLRSITNVPFNPLILPVSSLL